MTVAETMTPEINRIGVVGLPDALYSSDPGEEIRVVKTAIAIANRLGGSFDDMQLKHPIMPDDGSRHIFVIEPCRAGGEGAIRDALSYLATTAA